MTYAEATAMPYDEYGKTEHDEDWPTDDLQGEFNLDEELKETEEYVEEYDDWL